jgi:hypothetical protein
MQELFKKYSIEDYTIDYLVEEIYDILPKEVEYCCIECDYEDTLNLVKDHYYNTIKSDIEKIIRKHLEEIKGE